MYSLPLHVLEMADLTTSRIMTLPCDYALNILVFSVGGLCSCLIDNIPWVMYYYRNPHTYLSPYMLLSPLHVAVTLACCCHPYMLLSPVHDCVTLSYCCHPCLLLSALQNGVSLTCLCQPYILLSPLHIGVSLT